MKFAGLDFFMSNWYSSNQAALVGLVMYLAIIAYLIVATMKAKKN